MHPKSTVDPMNAAALYADLLAATQTRGDHATGTAVLACDGKVDTFKRAVKAADYLTMRATNNWLDSHFGAGVTIVLGHTRWATQNNRHLDTAAHPFTYGKITGAHNGIIRNDERVERQLREAGYKTGGHFPVDSEAAFAALDAIKSPQKALEMLNGYFALTWIKGASFYLARTPDAPLVVAYVPALRMMVYNSEQGILERALTRFGLDIKDKTAVEFYTPLPGEIYRYVPSDFTSKTTNVKKIGAFKLPERASKNFNSARPTAGTSVQRWEDDSPYSWTPKGGTSHKRPSTQSDWVSVNGVLTRREDVPRPTLDAMRVAQFDKKIEALENETRRLRDRIAELEDVIHGSTGELAEEKTDEAAMLDYGACEICGWRGDVLHPLMLTDDGLHHVECHRLRFDSPALPLTLLDGIA
jgi:hypothetical protein